MAFNMKLWQVSGKQLTEIEQATLDDEKRLEEWVVRDPSVIGIDVLLIGQQVTTDFGGRIDLLAMDADANLLVLELKRNRTPRDVVAQTLDYASWLKNLSYQDIEEIAEAYLQGKTLEDAFSDHFGVSLPDTVNTSQRMIVLASALDDSSERIIQYLSQEYDVPINAIFFNFFRSGTNEIVGRAWLMDPEVVQERAQSKKRAPWSGYYFVNVGEGGETRNWDDCRKYGFLAAGQGTWYSRKLRILKAGDMVFAYMKDLGYVGYGRITQTATMIRDFVVKKENQKLLDLPLKAKEMGKNSDNPELSEWVVGVEWIKTFPREQAKTFKGVFANQNIVCKLRQPETVDFLKREFGVA
jgi:hypothetical protein